MMPTTVRRGLLLLLAAATAVCSPSAQAQELLATSIFAPEAGDPDPTLSGLFKIDLDAGTASSFLPLEAGGPIFPTDVAVDPASGNIFVSTLLGTIMHYAPDGTPLPSPSGGAAGEFAVLAGGVNSLVFDGAGNLLAGDNTGRVSSWNPVTGVANPDVAAGLSFSGSGFISAVQVAPTGQVFAQVGNTEGGGPTAVFSIENGVATEILSTLSTPLFLGGNMLSIPSAGDTDADSDADVADLLALQRGFGAAGPGDLDGSGTVDAADAGILEANFGELADLLVADFAGNSLWRFDLDGSDPELFASLPPVVVDPFSNFPSEMMLSDNGTLLVSLLSSARRPDNIAGILEYDLQGNLLGTPIDGLPPLSGIAMTPPVLSPVAAVPEPGGVLLLLFAVTLSTRRR